MITLWQLVAWIEQHLHQHIPLSLLAEKVGCSTRHLGTRFRQTFGDSPAAYIQKRRLTLASNLLRFTHRNITEIAMMYQFSHLPSFTRAFRNHFGQSPQAYRLADHWDMSLFYPSVAVTGYTCHTDIVRIPEDICIVPVDNKKKEVHFGLDFTINTENGKIISDQKIHQSLINILFRKGTDYPIAVFGERSPGKDCDTDVNICMGYLTPYSCKPKGVSIPSGTYACFVFKGTPINIMRFHSWAQGHGMHIFRLIMKKGPTFSIFDKTTTEGIYKTEFYIPCLC
ncbi:AraC family transcriptional regulator [Salmonella enterica]|nr:AraC family transcriptional regulator [Salmonella enterica]EJF5594663.1 AraC family transcriptional regulator [Salmonella enterica]EJF5825828.1 AraC family transcriptional regulator [Salmonella enterica]EJF5844540.1 AraC family transcriptional regulator [Salmonella enterica]EJF5917017.1 AraC family transcriptional regulator [Salmonella enterica]